MTGRIILGNPLPYKECAVRSTLQFSNSPRGSPTSVTTLQSRSRAPALRYFGVVLGIMQKMETTIVYWGYLEIMEKRTETIIVKWVI